MPEGPEIRRAADEVQAALKGHRTLEVWFGLQLLKPFEWQLTGATVIRVETHGKAMLTRFDNDLTIYSHNQLYGRWYTLPSRQLPKTKRQLRLAIHNSRMSALLYSASDIQTAFGAPFSQQTGSRSAGHRNHIRRNPGTSQQQILAQSPTWQPAHRSAVCRGPGQLSAL